MVCVVLVDRANYGRLKPVMEAVRRHPQLDLQVVVSGTMLLRRFGYPVEIVEQDGFSIDGRIFVELEGATLVTMAKSVGFAVIEFASEFQRLQPDVVLLIGDRYEMLAAGVAAAYMNLSVAHVQGGEVSGSIDESARHALSKLAHFHFPATERAAEFLRKMGEAPRTILAVGCPSADLAQSLDRTLASAVINKRGKGAEIDVDQPFLLALYHPTTTQYGTERDQMRQILTALDEIRLPTVLLWSNIDAGSDAINKEIRMFRDTSQDWLHTITNLPPEEYLKVLARCVCAVGNSSSFVRDAGYFGTPVVLVGARQEGRERGEHVVQVGAQMSDIVVAIQRQLSHGRYQPCTLYGKPGISTTIAECLAKLEPYVQKRLHYIQEVVAE